MTVLAAIPVNISLDFTNKVPLADLARALTRLDATVIDGVVSSGVGGIRISARIPIHKDTTATTVEVPTLRIVAADGPAAQINAATAALPGPLGPAESTPAEEPGADPDVDKTVCCPTCGRRFSTAHALAVHNGRTHRGTPPAATPEPGEPPRPGLVFTCGDCGREYDDGTRLDHHRRVHHTPPADVIHEVASAGRRYL